MSFNPNPTPIPRKDKAQSAKQQEIEETVEELNRIQGQIDSLLIRLRAIVNEASDYKDCGS